MSKNSSKSGKRKIVAILRLAKAFSLDQAAVQSEL
jgi:hypothetical protein